MLWLMVGLGVVCGNAIVRQLCGNSHEERPLAGHVGRLGHRRDLQDSVPDIVERDPDGVADG